MLNNDALKNKICSIEKINKRFVDIKTAYILMKYIYVLLQQLAKSLNLNKSTSTFLTNNSRKYLCFRPGM